jgi:hypothetical protein
MIDTPYLKPGFLFSDREVANPRIWLGAANEDRFAYMNKRFGIIKALEIGIVADQMKLLPKSTSMAVYGRI